MSNEKTVTIKHRFKFPNDSRLKLVVDGQNMYSFDGRIDADTGRFIIIDYPENFTVQNAETCLKRVFETDLKHLAAIQGTYIAHNTKQGDIICNWSVEKQAWCNMLQLADASGAGSSISQLV